MTDDNVPTSGGSRVSSEFEINATAALATLTSESKNMGTLLTRMLDGEEKQNRRIGDLEVGQARAGEADAARDARMKLIEDILMARTLTWPKLLAGTAAAGAIIGTLIAAASLIF